MREFIQTENGRKVKAMIDKFHLYHPECAPEGAKEEFVSTKQSCCHKCYEPLYKKSI